jgi:hypothetical protein
MRCSGILWSWRGSSRRSRSVSTIAASSVISGPVSAVAIPLAASSMKRKSSSSGATTSALSWRRMSGTSSFYLTSLSSKDNWRSSATTLWCCSRNAQPNCNLTSPTSKSPTTRSTANCATHYNAATNNCLTKSKEPSFLRLK